MLSTIPFVVVVVAAVVVVVELSFGGSTDKLVGPNERPGAPVLALTYYDCDSVTWWLVR